MHLSANQPQTSNEIFGSRIGRFDISNAEAELHLFSSQFEAEAGVLQAKTPKKLQEVADALTEEGFVAIGRRMEISDVNHKPITVDNALTAFDPSRILPTFNLELEASGVEDIVAIEFNAETGDIINWQFANFVSTITPVTASLDQDGPLQSRHVFNIPLVSFSGESNIEVSAEASFVVKAFKKAQSAVKKVKKIIQLFSVKKMKKLLGSAKRALLKKLALKIDKKIKKSEALQVFDSELKLKRFSKANATAMKGKRVLLLVHGILSSTRGAFGGLASSMDTFQELSQIYDGNIIAYDHWTLSKSTKQNALDLIKLLPDNVDLDIVCHSRGAGVVRCLLEVESIKHRLSKRGINVDKACFVAGACEGSQLAKKNALNQLFRRIRGLSSLVGGFSVGPKIVLGLVKILLRGAQQLPGTESMNPSGAIIKKLKDSKDTAALKYCYFRANFDPKNWVKHLGDEFIIDQTIFNGAANDVIVPFEGAGKNKNYLDGKVEKIAVLDFGTKTAPQHEVWHTTFFADPSFQAALLLTLK